MIIIKDNYSSPTMILKHRLPIIVGKEVLRLTFLDLLSVMLMAGTIGSRIFPTNRGLCQ